MDESINENNIVISKKARDRTNISGEESIRNKVRVKDHLARIRSENSGGYEFFQDVEQRRDIVEISSALTRYVHDFEVKNLVFVDRAARPAWIGFNHFWKKYYPDEKRPDIYFVNPDGFMTGVDLLKISDLGLPKVALMMTDRPSEVGDLDSVGEVIVSKDSESVAKNFKSVYRKLVSNNEQSTLIFDNCIHSGDSLSPIVRTFNEVGFQNLHLGVVSRNLDYSGMNLDFVALNRPASGSCYPFDHDYMVHKSIRTLLSEPAVSKEDFDRSKKLRNELRRVLNEADGNWEIDSNEVRNRVESTKHQVYDQEVSNRQSFREFIKTFVDQFASSKPKSITPNYNTKRLEMDFIDPFEDNFTLENKIEYKDQLPRIETWGLSGNGDSEQKVLTYHESGDRYIIKEDGNFEVIHDGHLIKVNSDKAKRLQEAISNSPSNEVKLFYGKVKDKISTHDSGK